MDDATGTVSYALFREQEDTQGYFLLLRGVIERHGIPLAVYTDRHAVFQHWRHGTEEISASLGTGKPTQCGRALREMGVTQVFAHSPEANGVVKGKNNRIKVIKRMAYGYRNSHNFRQRILLSNHKEVKPKAA